MMTSGRPFSPAANGMSLIPGFSGVLLLAGLRFSAGRGLMASLGGWGLAQPHTPPGHPR